MTTVDDPATALEQFIHDVANLPAEIAHHLEEIQAKDQAMIEYRNHISSRDAAIQRHVRNNGGHIRFPQEEKYIAAVKINYDKALALQEEKCLLAQKVTKLLDRHVKRYDLQLRELIAAGVLSSDSTLPSLLEETAANLVPIPSTTGTGANTPIGSRLGLIGGSSTSIADLAKNRTFPPTIISSSARVAPVASPAVVAVQQAAAGVGTPASAPRSREGSAGASDAKRRRPQGATLNIPAQPSGLRQSSQGPAVGTPKATTPGAPGSRAGSAGPARTRKTVRKPVPAGATGSGMRKAIASKSGMSKAQRRLMQGKKGTPSTEESSHSDDELSEEEGGDDAGAPRKPGKDAGGDEEMEDAEAAGAAHDYDDEGDDTRYCICQQPSHGDMVACDNENCDLEWFHWGCVGLTAPPKGRWLCPRCKDLPKAKLKLAR